jgi:hypothetical protein
MVKSKFNYIMTNKKNSKSLTLNHSNNFPRGQKFLQIVGLLREMDHLLAIIQTY